MPSGSSIHISAGPQGSVTGLRGMRTQLRQLLVLSASIPHLEPDVGMLAAGGRGG